jgi:U3 small nucleolar RNA-associated protein 25
LKPAQAPEAPSSTSDWSKLFVKQQIQQHLAFANSANSNQAGLTPLQSEVFAVLNNYQDLYLPERTNQNAEELRFAYCLHAVNHVLKTRAKILLHNSRLVNRSAEVPDEFRDQGLVRPKVLILLPFRDSALR